ncbi:sulfite exporter TauE/SafE family protein [Xanthobacteraceae bacterium Astr-EGSB]|uniref:sulfite exporter TauE/SafE family protein n=1 Tax=Astrobacterium formosum TaxID=3069710 RepID=UPI0027AEAC56|nr:sulfite exporter TauE/SafE family protein [Xanthobacteraceae bacterium Astr-EGSB]
MWSDILPPLVTIAVAAPAIIVAYVIFGIAGFGAALISAPVLAHVMPVATIVPLLALMDCVASLINGLRLSDKMAKDELKVLVPLMALGTALGITLLLVVPPRPMMLALGIFVIAYALYGFLAPPPTSTIDRRWAWLTGPVGGVFSGMFGSGGPIYAMYLSRRLTDRDAFRATQTAQIAFATLTRGAMFAFAGVYSDWRMLGLLVALAPAMLIGTWIGHHMTLRLSREVFLRILHGLLIASGISLIVRASGLFG